MNSIEQRLKCYVCDPKWEGSDHEECIEYFPGTLAAIASALVTVTHKCPFSSITLPLLFNHCYILQHWYFIPPNVVPRSSITLSYCSIRRLTSLHWYFIPRNFVPNGLLQRFQWELAHHHGQDVSSTDPATSVIIVILIFSRILMTLASDAT